VTQIIGIVMKDCCIAIGGDSRYSYENGKADDGQKKVFRLTFVNQVEALIAFCGVVNPAIKVIKRIEHLASKTEAKRVADVWCLVRQAMTEYKQAEIARNRLANNTAKQVEHFQKEKQFFAFMVGFYVKGNPRFRPHLFTTDIVNIQHRSHPRYATLGSGERECRAILKDFFKHPSLLKYKYSVPVIIEALERIKGQRFTCGGALQVGTIDAWILDPKTHLPKAPVLFDDYERKPHFAILKWYQGALKQLRDRSEALTTTLLDKLYDDIGEATAKHNKEHGIE
jgi:20S proteasome alpha/beta subunit